MTHFLVTEEKPDGSKLEDILTLIRQDIIKRIGKIADDSRPEACQVLKNNIRILSLITECIEIAENSTKLLEKSFGPSTADQPRIGVR